MKSRQKWYLTWAPTTYLTVLGWHFAIDLPTIFVKMSLAISSISRTNRNALTPIQLERPEWILARCSLILQKHITIVSTRCHGSNDEILLDFIDSFTSKSTANGSDYRQNQIRIHFIFSQRTQSLKWLFRYRCCAVSVMQDAISFARMQFELNC